MLGATPRPVGTPLARGELVGVPMAAPPPPGPAQSPIAWVGSRGELATVLNPDMTNSAGT